MNTRTRIVDKVLTYTFVVFLFCIGLDKIVQTDLITNWQLIVGPVVHFLLPVGLGSVVMVEGVIEMLLGILLLTRLKTYAIALLAITIFLVTVDLFILHYYNLAVHEGMFIAVLITIYILDTNRISVTQPQV